MSPPSLSTRNLPLPFLVFFYRILPSGGKDLSNADSLETFLPARGEGGGGRGTTFSLTHNEGFFFKMLDNAESYHNLLMASVRYSAAIQLYITLL
jgi:hypothetical protein